MNVSNFEKIISYILAPIGLLAIIVNLFFIKGFSVADGLDALKDIAGLTVAFVVVLLAIKAFKPTKKITSFYEKLESKLNIWVADNKYLVSENTDRSYDGRVFDIICDLDRFADEEASMTKKLKGKFIYFPSKKNFENKKHVIIKINKSTFKKRYNDEYDKVKDFIIGKIGDKIEIIFTDLNIVQRRTEPEHLEISFTNIEETDENAQRIIDVLEFTKTMILAIA